jgi:hypothetical protein
MELLNVNNSLSDLVYGEQNHNWTDIEENGTRNIGAGPPLISGLLNDAKSQSVIFENDHESASNDSFVSPQSVAEDLFDVDVASSSDSLLHSSPLLSQRA